MIARSLLPLTTSTTLLILLVAGSDACGSAADMPAAGDADPGEIETSPVSYKVSCLQVECNAPDDIQEIDTECYKARWCIWKCVSYAGRAGRYVRARFVSTCDDECWAFESIAEYDGVCPATP